MYIPPLDAFRFRKSLAKCLWTAAACALALRCLVMLDRARPGAWWTDPLVVTLAVAFGPLLCEILVDSLLAAFDRKPVLILTPAYLFAPGRMSAPLSWAEIVAIERVWARHIRGPENTELGVRPHFAIRLRDPRPSASDRKANAPRWQRRHDYDIFVPIGCVEDNGRYLFEVAERFRLQAQGENLAHRAVFFDNRPLLVISLILFTSLLVPMALWGLSLEEPFLVGQGLQIGDLSVILLLCEASLIWLVVWRVCNHRPAIELSPRGLFDRRFMKEPLPWTEIVELRRCFVFMWDPRGRTMGLRLADKSKRMGLPFGTYEGALAARLEGMDAYIPINALERGARHFVETLELYYAHFGPAAGSSPHPAGERPAPAEPPNGRSPAGRSDTR